MNKQQAFGKALSEYDELVRKLYDTKYYDALVMERDCFFADQHQPHFDHASAIKEINIQIGKIKLFLIGQQAMKEIKFKYS